MPSTFSYITNVKQKTFEHCVMPLLAAASPAIFSRRQLAEGYHSLSFVNMTQKTQMASHVIIRNYTYMH